MNDKRYIQSSGKKEGPFSLRQLMRMTELREIDHRTLFWAKGTKSWEPLIKLIFDVEPGRIDDLISAGVERVEVIGSGTGKDCPACSALDGIFFKIDESPVLPPSDCCCLPWCRCDFIASV